MVTLTGLVWSLEPLAKNKFAPHNIVRCASGLPRKQITATPKGFLLFVTPVIIQEIVNCANSETKSICEAN